MEKPKVKLLGENGNAFAIMGKVMRALEDAGWEKDKISKVIEEMKSGDYDHLLRTAMKYCEVE